MTRDLNKLLVVGFVALSIAWAAQEPLLLELTSYRVVETHNDRGEKVEAFRSAESATPGDLLEWRLHAVNRSGTVIHDVILVIPIPAGTVYQPGTALPLVLGEAKVLPEFSYDGGVQFSRPPLYRKAIIEVSGIKKEVQVEVPPEAYTHVRWVLPEFAPGRTVTVQLRTRVR